MSPPTRNASQSRFRIMFKKEDPESAKGHRWIQVGAAFPYKRSEGFFIRLDALPIGFDGQLAMFPVDEQQRGGPNAMDVPPPIKDDDAPF